MPRLFSNSFRNALVRTATSKLRQVWETKVSGTSAEITNALKILKNKPKDIEELAKTVRDERRKALGQDLAEAKENFKKYGY